MIVSPMIAAPWLASTLAMAGVTWLAIRAYSQPRSRAYVIGALVAASVAALPAAFLPLSHGAPWAPPVGTYALLAASMGQDKGIYVLLDVNGEPRLFVMPWNAWQANQIQAAMDSVNGGGDGTLTFNSGGGVEVDNDPPVSGDDAKQPEQAVTQ
jgi:hypothetical protein